MVSKERKRAVLYEKLQLLRSATNSQALGRTSIIVEASKYIKELKQKVDHLNQVTTLASSSSDQSLPMVTVESLDKSFLINVFLKKSSPGALVSILEAFEELGLNLIEARVCCEDPFRLEAVGEIEDDNGQRNIDAQLVKQAMLQAIKNCCGNEE